MERQHINERGTHTTIIEAARPVLDFFKKCQELEEVKVSPGKIDGGLEQSQNQLNLSILMMSFTKW